MHRSNRNFLGAALMSAAFLVLLVPLLVPSTSDAFSLGGIGPRIGAIDPEGLDGTFAMGMHLDFEKAGSRVHLMPNVLFWDESGLSDINPNLDVMYHFSPAGRVSPYLGAGVGIHFYSSDGPGDPGSDPSANFFGGLLLPVGPTSLFLEGRAVVSDMNQFGILAGATFALGR
jgi:hypothetical protein